MKQGATAIAGLATQTVTFTHKVGAIDGSKSTFAASPKTGAQLLDDGAGGSTLTFTAKDATGALIKGLTNITFKSSLAGATSGAVTETPASSGIYVAKLTSTAAGAATVTVQQGGSDVAGVATQVVTFTHKVGAIDGSKSHLAVTPTIFAGDGTEKGVITFAAKDASGAAVTGLTDITFPLTGAATATSTVGAITETPAGTYTAELSGTAAGAVSVGVAKAATAIAGVTPVAVTLS